MFSVNYPNKQEYAELLSKMLDQYFKKQKEFYQQNSIGDLNFIFYAGTKEWYAIRLIDPRDNYAPVIGMHGDMQWLGCPVIKVEKEFYFHMALKDRD